MPSIANERGRVLVRARVVSMATMLTATLLVSPSFAISYLPSSSSPAFGDATTMTAIMIPRGGGIGFGRRNKSGGGGAYAQALDDEIVWLEQQLRRVHKEKRVLTKNISKRHFEREATMPIHKNNDERDKNDVIEQRQRDDADADDQDDDLLRLANLEQLESRKESLLNAKLQLESLKLDCDLKLLALQSDLSDSDYRDDLERTFLARVAELETSLRELREATIGGVDKEGGIINDLQLSRRIDEACQKVILDFWKEGNRKLEEYERKLKASFEEELREERRSAKVAVEKQRRKMRALAKVTAIKERDLAAKTKILRAQEEAKKDKLEMRLLEKQQEEQASLERAKEEERERRRSILEDAERKAKEEEERLWLQLERELGLEREKLRRIKKREEEEKRRCEQEELERQRIMQQYTLDREERRKREQQDAANNGNNNNSSFTRSFFKKIFGSTTSKTTTAIVEDEKKKETTTTTPQPSNSLPPKEVVQITALANAEGNEDN